MKTLPIGFGYKARRGKDTVVQTIIDNFNCKEQPIKRYAFADALKREVNQAAENAGSMFNLFMQLSRKLPGWVKFDTAAPMNDPLCPLGKQRDLLQWWGTEYRRAQDPFYWVKQLALTIREEEPAIALISDMRFLNEALWVRDMGGVTVKVERVGYLDVSINASHPSEVGLDHFLFDYEIIAPDGDIEELKRDAVRLFDIIKESMNPPPLEDVTIIPPGSAYTLPQTGND